MPTFVCNSAHLYGMTTARGDVVFFPRIGESKSVSYFWICVELRKIFPQKIH